MYCTWLIFLYSNLRFVKLYVIQTVGKIFDIENIRINGNRTEQVKLCDKGVLSDCKIR